jgi:hypothetical protein
VVQSFVWGGKYTTGEYLEQIPRGLAFELGPTTAKIGYVVLGLVVAGLLLAFWRTGDSGPEAGQMRHLLTITAVSLVGLFVLFNALQIFEPLTKRFVWHVPLALVTALGVLTSVRRSLPWARWVLLALLLLVLVCAAGRAYSVFEGRIPSLDCKVVRANYTVDPGYYTGGEAVIQGKHILVSPPYPLYQ